MKTDKIFTFRIPVELLDAGHALAEAQDLTLAQLMRRLLKEAVARRGSNHDREPAPIPSEGNDRVHVTIETARLSLHGRTTSRTWYQTSSM